MADEADRAAMHIEADLSIALSKREKTLKATGLCYYCQDNVRDGLLFCGKECASDYEFEEKLKKQNGLS